MSDDFLPVIPVSVIELAAQGKRPKTDHASESSRSAYSGFPEEAVDLAYSLFLRHHVTIFDPFAGWGERGVGAARYGKTYHGIDLSAASVASCAARGVTITQADARTYTPPAHSGLLTCPPYWNLERYGDGGGIDGAASFAQCCRELDSVWRLAVSSLERGGTVCVVVGDWRKGGVYHDLTARTEHSLEACGLEPFDKVVLSRRTVTKIKIMLPQAKRLGYTVRCHETMLVYRKP